MDSSSEESSSEESEGSESDSSVEVKKKTKDKKIRFADESQSSLSSEVV